MAEQEQTPEPIDFFKRWQLEVLKNARLSAQLAIAREEAFDKDLQIASMVPRLKAKLVAKQAYTLGQLKGKRVLLGIHVPW